MLAVKYFHKNWMELNEQQQFLEILYGNNHDGFIVRIKDREYKPKYSTQKIIAIESYDLSCNTWVTLNTFSKPSKKQEYLREITGIYFDLDLHADNISYVRLCTERTKDILKQAYKDKLLPEPTMVTDTGRGLGIFYMLDRSIANTSSTAKQRRFYQHICKSLGEVFKSLLEAHDDVLQVDSSVVGDVSRVVRLPLTFNVKAGRKCRLESIGTDAFGSVLRYELSDFKSYIEYNKYNDRVSRSARRELKNKIVNFETYKLPFLQTRLYKLERLQEISAENCEGRRELMCFFYYNAAKQIMSKDAAMERTYLFNDGFKNPIGKAEIKNIIKATDKNKAVFGGYEGFYKIKDSTIIDKLDLSPQEQQETQFGMSTKDTKRLQKKIHNHVKKFNRNKEIIDYTISHPEATYSEIAQLHGVSLSTLKRILKDNDVSRNKKREDSAPKKLDTVSSFDRREDNTKRYKKVQNLPTSLFGGVFLSTTTLDRTLNASEGEVEGSGQLIYLDKLQDAYKTHKSGKRKNAVMRGQLYFGIAENGIIYIENG